MRLFGRELQANQLTDSSGIVPIWGNILCRLCMIKATLGHYYFQCCHSIVKSVCKYPLQKKRIQLKRFSIMANGQQGYDGNESNCSHNCLHPWHGTKMARLGQLWTRIPHYFPQIHTQTPTHSDRTRHNQACLPRKPHLHFDGSSWLDPLIESLQKKSKPNNPIL